MAGGERDDRSDIPPLMIGFIIRSVHPLPQHFPAIFTLRGEGKASTTICLMSSSLSSWQLPTSSRAGVWVGGPAAVPAEGAAPIILVAVTSTSIRPPVEQ